MRLFLRSRRFSSGRALGHPGEGAFFHTFCADVDSFGMAVDYDTHLLEVGEEFAFGRTAYLASGAAFFLG